ncbi:15453_t:CDS:2, partial [Cetraspora pellucida]
SVLMLARRSQIVRSDSLSKSSSVRKVSSLFSSSLCLKSASYQPAIDKVFL